MNEISILQSFSTWVSENWLASAILGGVTWDITKEYLLLPLKNKIGKYFIDDEQVQNYIETVSSTNVINIKKPYRDIEDIYENITNQEVPLDLTDTLKEFFIENKELIEAMNKRLQTNSIFQISNQHATRDINNVNGHQIIINN